MPISPSLITHAEVVINANVIAGGSTVRANQIVLHYRRASTVPVLSKAALDTAVRTLLRPLIQAAVNIRYLGTNYAIRWIDDAQDAYLFTTHADAGLVAGDSMPTINAAFFLFQTGLRGRSYRGSKHIFPMAESATTTPNDDIFNAGALTYLNALGAGFLSNVTDANGNVWTPQVLSRKLSQLKVNPTTVIANDVTAVLLNKRVGVMRHRRVKTLY